MQLLKAYERLDLGIINDPYHLKLIMKAEDALIRHVLDFNLNPLALSTKKMKFPLQ